MTRVSACRWSRTSRFLALLVTVGGIPQVGGTPVAAQESRELLREILRATPAIATTSVVAAQQTTGRFPTQEEMFRRNVGSREDQRTQFPPHRIIGNLYYVGTNTFRKALLKSAFA